MTNRLEPLRDKGSSLFMLFVAGGALGVICGAGSLLYLLIVRRMW